MTDLRDNSSDSQSAVILQMEKKLNPQAFWRRLWTQDKFCTISTAQYWDWLTYIDVRFSKLNNEGRLLDWVGGPQDEGTILLAITRDEWTILGSPYLRMGTYIPIDGTYCEVSNPRMDVEIPSRHDNRYLPRHSGSKLAKTKQDFSRINGSARSPRHLPKKNT